MQSYGPGSIPMQPGAPGAAATDYPQLHDPTPRTQRAYDPTYPPPACTAPPAVKKKRRWLRMLPIWSVLIIGYSTLGRSFAYLGVPPLFIGEAYLGYSLLANRGGWLNRFVDGVARLHLLPLAVLMTMLWGLFDVALPVFYGGSVKECLRTCAFNYYPIFIFIGMSIGRELSYERFILFWKWFVCLFCIYAVVYVIFGWEVEAPWKPENSLFGQPALAGFVPVGMMALWTTLRHWKLRWIVLPMSMIPIFYSSGRGAVLGLLVGVFTIAATSLRRFVLVMSLMGALVTLMAIIGPAIEGEEGRAENLHPAINLARLIATIDDDAAYRMLIQMGYYGAAEDMIVAKGTSLWRKEIWKNAVDSLNTTPLLLIGQGHGTSVSDLTPDGQEIHTPHNFVIYALYYTGAIGLAVFCFMLGALFLASRRIPEPNLRSLQTAHVLMMVVVAAVGNMFETPIAAIPFYMLSGIILALPTNSPQLPWRRAA